MKNKMVWFISGAISLLALGLMIQTPPDPLRVKLGDSEARVMALLGQPYEVNDAPSFISRGVNPYVRDVNAGQCVREFVYRQQEGGRQEQLWYVGFDSDRRVISSYGHRPRQAYAHNQVQRVKSPAGEQVGE